MGPAILCALGIGICLHQRHFVLSLLHPDLYLMTGHRCGDVLLAALTWALIESA